MSAGDLYNELYQIENIKKIYHEKIKIKCSPGLDRINRRIFENEFEENINIINTKVYNGTYKFTKYKQKLISKGIGKKPRVVSIPTVRDKITLLIMKDIIVQTFGNEVSYSVIHSIIKNINDSIKTSSFDYFFKIDLSQFYDTINHDLLIKKIKSKIKKKSLLQLIEKAIKTPTVEEHYSKENRTVNEKGVPQGLSISNALAGLYLSKFDLKHEGKIKYKYFRFVDDILVLCYKKDFEKIKCEVEFDLEQKYLLHINKEKEESGEISKKEISYLGYLISGNNITVRSSSKRKLELSLENLFKEYAVFNKYKRNLFVWKLNIKITGLIHDGNKLGWAFFFSQITDERILFHFDWLINGFIKRFNLQDELKDIKIKKYVRTLMEIKKNLHGTSYIPNLDRYTVEDKRDFIENVLGVNTSKFIDDEIIEMFEKETYKFIKELERDLQHFS